MRYLNPTIASIAFAAAALTACGGGNGRGDSHGTNGTEFTPFVKSVLDNDPRNEPVAINDRDLRFTDRDNTNVYDDVLQ